MNQILLQFITLSKENNYIKNIDDYIISKEQGKG